MPGLWQPYLTMREKIWGSRPAHQGCQNRWMKRKSPWQYCWALPPALSTFGWIEMINVLLNLFEYLLLTGKSSTVYNPWQPLIIHCYKLLSHLVIWSCVLVWLWTQSQECCLFSYILKEASYEGRYLEGTQRSHTEWMPLASAFYSSLLVGGRGSM